MKILFSFLLLTIFFTSTAQIPTYVPTNGLVGYWPFNGNANDESGNGNNGIVNGATLTSDRFGNVNSAYQFDGINNNILIPDNSIYNFESSGQFSISYWVRFISISNVQGSIIICKQTGSGITQDGWSSYVDVDTLPRTRFQNGSPTSLADLSAITKVQINKDYFIAVTFDKIQNQVKYYIDGVFQVQSAVGNGLIGNNGNGIIIGKPSWIYSNAKGIDGKIDDIAIYNRAISQVEINQLYNSNVFPTTPEDTTSNVGIGTSNPKRKLHINDVMRLEPRNTAPINSAKGDIYFDGVLNKLRVYDGTVWQNCW
jgi:hypothetical protein